MRVVTLNFMCGAGTHLLKVCSHCCQGVYCPYWRWRKYHRQFTRRILPPRTVSRFLGHWPQLQLKPTPSLKSKVQRVCRFVYFLSNIPSLRLPNAFCSQRFWSFGFCSKLVLSFFSIHSDQVGRRYNWDSPVDWLDRDTWRCGISGTKDWPHTLQGLDQLYSRDCFIRCEFHFQPTTSEVLYPKQQCWIMVAYHIPWWRTSNFKGRGWQRLRAHQGRQLPLNAMSKLKCTYYHPVFHNTLYVVNLRWYIQ